MVADLSPSRFTVAVMRPGVSVEPGLKAFNPFPADSSAIRLYQPEKSLKAKCPDAKVGLRTKLNVPFLEANASSAAAYNGLVILDFGGLQWRRR